MTTSGGRTGEGARKEGARSGTTETHMQREREGGGGGGEGVVVVLAVISRMEEEGGGGGGGCTRTERGRNKRKEEAGMFRF